MTILDRLEGGASRDGDELIAGSRIEDARIHNRRLVFETIFQRGPISRVEISGIIGLKPQTISSITRELLEQELIVEAGRSSGLRGQPQIYLEANAEAGWSIGIHLDQNHCSILAFDLKRCERGRRSLRLDTKNPASAVRVLAAAILGLLEENNQPVSKVWGIGLVLPTFGSRVYDFDFSIQHWDAWRDVSFAEELHRLTGMPVLVENDATAAAIGERIHRPDASEASFVYYYIGHGSGAGIIIDGYPFKGVGGNAGEVGLLPVPGIPANPVWSNGAAEPSEPSANLLSIEGLAAACGVDEANLDDGVIDQMLVMRDHRLMDWLANAAQVLRDVTAIIEVMFDPGFIAVGGPLPRAIVERLVDRAYPLRPTPAARHDRSVPRLLPAKLIEDAAVTGAAMLPIFVNISHNFRHLYFRQLLSEDGPGEA
ncbi:ROK family protein [Pleomorphomonas sp. PLEO]|uniref:ROK family protein n=1 Tax=Pleomorphomonas sp. PLEO TaxID=3239306 RepID=UPI00351E3C7D